MPTWEEIEASRERERLVDGGAVKNASGTQTVFRWATRVPNLSELERLPDELAFRRKTLEAFRTIKTRKRSRARANPERGRAELEARGLAFLDRGFDSDAKKRPCALRMFYRSEGGEVLACESDPMTFAACEAARSSRPWFGWALAVDTVPATPGSLHAVKQVEIPHDVRHRLKDELGAKSWRDVPAQARFVVFPSQVPDADDAAPRDCPDCGCAELCRPDCRIAPWNQEVVK